ncbi:MAG: ParB/RepB/Spo0J family partition protein [Firmicutes bacterium]|nr:ParB/RepB/Spo0J family partition protein [Bacillota bacterium]
MAAPKKSGLGRGLEALFGDVEINIPEAAEEEVTEKKPAAKKTGKSSGASKSKAKEEKVIDENSVVYLDINDIKPNENQPRKTFDDEKIAELAASILEHGLIQPIVVRKSDFGYEIVAGERRYRAARKAELKTIPCLVRELTDEQNMLLAIIENVQREDLNAIEEARAIEKMIKTYGLTQEQVSKSLSKSRPYITNALRLLKLPEVIQDMVVSGELSQGHARALVSIEDEEKKIALAKRAVSENLSVREIEKLAEGSKKKGKPAARKKQKSIEVKTVEEDLKLALGTKVNLVEKGKKGKIEIEYYSREELERLIDLLKAIK